MILCAHCETRLVYSNVVRYDTFVNSQTTTNPYASITYSRRKYKYRNNGRNSESRFPGRINVLRKGRCRWRIFWWNGDIHISSLSGASSLSNHFYKLIYVEVTIESLWPIEIEALRNLTDLIDTGLEDGSSRFAKIDISDMTIATFTIILFRVEIRRTFIKLISYYKLH